MIVGYLYSPEAEVIGSNYRVRHKQNNHRRVVFLFMFSEGSETAGYFLTFLFIHRLLLKFLHLELLCIQEYG